MNFERGKDFYGRKSTLLGEQMGEVGYIPGFSVGGYLKKTKNVNTICSITVYKLARNVLIVPAFGFQVK